MKQSPSAESDTETHSANQEVSPTVKGPKVYYCVCKRVLLVLNQRNKKSPNLRFLNVITRNCYIFFMNPLYNLPTYYHIDLFWYYPPICT